MKKICYSLFAAALMLGACSTMYDKPTQEITVKTPGARETICTLKNSMNNVKVRPPETVRINDSDEDLTITCHATSNRSRTLVIHSMTQGTTFLNVMNGFVGGFAVDQATKSLFFYPKMVEVDFEGIDPKPNNLPAYDHFAREHPELTGVEEFRPGWPTLMSDSKNPIPRMKKYSEEEGSADAASDSNSTDTGAESSSAGAQSDQNATADSLTRQYNPGVFDGSRSSGPAPSAAVQDGIAGGSSSEPVRLFSNE